MSAEMILIVMGGITFFVKGVIEKVLWSVSIYFFRGEFNYDNNEKTPDKFLKYNNSTNTFRECFITEYTLTGVRWGFFYKGMYVSKLTFWLKWADGRESRFPMPVPVDCQTTEGILKLIKTR